MKCLFYSFVDTNLYFLVGIGGGEFKRYFIEKCKYFPSLCQTNPKGFHSLKCLDLTNVSPTIVENFMQGQDFNNLRWLCLKNYMLQKLPSN
jgi:hypothetical protein